MNERVYLEDIPFEDAWSKFEEALRGAGLDGVLAEETVEIEKMETGRILAQPVWAKRSVPHYHSAAMDGFAVLAEDTHGAGPANPVTLRVGDGAYYVDTGDALPEGANAVVPVENVEAIDAAGEMSAQVRHPYAIRIRAAVTPWNHMRAMGEDMVAGELVLPAGRALEAYDLGAAAASGHSHLSLSRRPTVGIIPTGSELVAVGSEAEPGQIIEFNSLVLAAQVEHWGGQAERYPIVKDDLKLLRKAVKAAAAKHDLVLVNAGSSAGEQDYTARVIDELGKVLVHGVAVRPGHPVILGMLHSKDNGLTPVIGVPGYPVSAALTGELFVKPLLERWLGKAPETAKTVSARLTTKLNSPAGDDDYVRVSLAKIGEQIWAAPLKRGAGVISSLTRADGLALVPRGSQGKAAGTQIDVRLLRQREELESALLATGSHDMTLDIMAQFLGRIGIRLSSSNVGSLGGLLALQRGQAHLAGSHLLDPDSGEYNRAYVKEHLAGIPVRLVGLVGRQQGLMMVRGNPKGIQSLEDLVQEGIRFVNRQRGSGTRLLLDYELNRIGIAGSNVEGYNREEFTHLAAAAAVASGRADCALGIAAAAKALDLDFIPLFDERYDLVIPQTHWEHPSMRALLALLDEPAFRQAVLALPGYDLGPMGEITDLTE